IRNNTHQVGGHAENVSSAQQIGADNNVVGGHGPTAVGVMNIIRWIEEVDEVIAVRCLFKIAEGKIRSVVPVVVRRNGKLDWNLGQVRVVSEREISEIFGDNRWRIFPRRSVRIISLIHHNGDDVARGEVEGNSKRPRSPDETGVENIYVVCG